jgi:hypothetical protein
MVMKTVTTFLIAFAALCFLTRPVMARTFYLKNGEEINYQKSWMKNGRIQVLINRDTLVSFAPDEVDMKKTYRQGLPKKRVKHHHGKRHKGALRGHKKGMKPLAAGKTAVRKTAQESSEAKKAIVHKPAMKTPAGAQKKMPVQAPKTPGKPSHAPVKNAPVAR